MSARLLLVDDDHSMRMTLSVLLEDEGYAVSEAASCAEASRALEAGAFDLVILDNHLGDGLGSSLVPLIRARGTTKILLASGSETNPCDGDAVFVKGAPSQQLLEMIDSLVTPR